MNCGNLFRIYQEFTSEDLHFFKIDFLKDLPGSVLCFRNWEMPFNCSNYLGKNNNRKKTG